MTQQARLLDLSESDKPLVVRGYQIPTLIMRLLQERWNGLQPSWIPKLEPRVWLRPTGPQTKNEVGQTIQIGRMGEYTGDTHANIPKLIIRREALARVPNGMDHGKRQTPINDGPGIIYEKCWAGSFVIFAMSKIETESELLAFDTSELLAHFEAKIQEDLEASKFMCSQVGVVGTLKEYPNFFVVPVVCDYAYRDNIRITVEGTAFREITLNASIK